MFHGKTVGYFEKASKRGKARPRAVADDVRRRKQDVDSR
jgi:hypothetical protein